MTRAAHALAALALIVPAVVAPAPPALAVPGGAIGTLEQGRYTCELPGDATAAAGRHVPASDFTVISASSYRHNGTLGSYLLTGDQLVMTNGPHRGKKFHRLSRGFLRQLNDDGSDGVMRCVLGRRPSDAPAPCPDRPDDAGPSLQTPQASATERGRQAACATDASTPART